MGFPSSCAPDVQAAAPAVDLARLLLSLGVSSLPATPRDNCDHSFRFSSPHLVPSGACRGVCGLIAASSYPHKLPPGASLGDGETVAARWPPSETQLLRDGLLDVTDARVGWLHEIDDWVDDELPPWPH